MLRGDFSSDPVDPHVFSVAEINPTDAEIQAVRDWATNAVASMVCEDTEFVYRTATRADIEDTFTQWILEEQDIPKYTEAGDLWEAILVARKKQVDPTPRTENTNRRSVGRSC